MPVSGGTSNRNPKAKRASHHGLLHNLVADVRESTTGLIPGLATLGKASAHDVGHLLGVSGGAYQLDDIGKAIGKSYADYYGPLTHGDVGGFLHNVHEHPLELGLDTLALVTGGGAAAGKAGMVAAKAGGVEGRLAQIGAKAAGLERAAGRGASLEDVAATLGEGGVVARDGSHLVPRRRTLANLADNLTLDQGRVSRNPVVRARKDAVEGLLAKADKRTGGSLNAKRVYRGVKREESRNAKREGLQASREYDAAVAKLNKHERLALRALAAGYTPAQYADKLQSKLDAGEITDKWRRPKVEARIKQHRAEKVVAAGQEPSERLQKAVDLAAKLGKHNTDELMGDVPAPRNMTRDEVVDAIDAAKKDVRGMFGGKKVALQRAFNPAHGTGRVKGGDFNKMRGGKSIDEAAAENRAASEQRLMANGGKVVVKTQESPDAEGALWHYLEQYADGGTPERPHKRLPALTDANGEHVNESDLARLFLEHGINREAAGKILATDAKRSALEDALAGFDDPMRDPESPFHDPDLEPAGLPMHEPEGLTPERAAERAAMESLAVTGAAPEGDVATFTHRVLDRKKRDAPTLKNAGRLSESKYNTGTAFDQAMESRDPRILSQTTQRIAKAQAHVRVLERIKQGAVEVSLGDSRLRKHYVGIPKDSKVLGEMKDVQAFLDGPAREAFGDDDDLARIRSFYDDLVAKASNQRQGQVLAVSKAGWEELQKELRPTSAMIRRFIDKPTQVWRDLTLSLRPAWVANNAIGQYMLGAISVGPAAFARGMVEQAGAKGKLVDEVAPDIGSQGFVHQNLGHTLEAGEDASKTVKALAWTPRKIGALNAKLTDDAPRRAVFLATLRPMVKQLQREARRHGHDPLSFRDAAEEILSHPQAVEDITRKVIGDLVDFSNLTDVERTWMRRILPFYSWLRGIAVRTGQITLDNPALALAGAKVSQTGLDANRELLGALPSYLRGVLPIGPVRGGEATGTVDALTTQGMNPFSTIADEAGMFGVVGDREGAKFGGENVLSSLNPVGRVPLEALANRDFFSGRDIDREGTSSFADRFVHQGARSIPQLVLLDKMAPQNAAMMKLFGPPPKSSIYAPSRANPLLGYVGYPRKRILLGRAHQIAGLEAAGPQARIQ